MQDRISLSPSCPGMCNQVWNGASWGRRPASFCPVAPLHSLFQILLSTWLNWSCITWNPFPYRVPPTASEGQTRNCCEDWEVKVTWQPSFSEGEIRWQMDAGAFGGFQRVPTCPLVHSQLLVPMLATVAPGTPTEVVPTWRLLPPQASAQVPPSSGHACLLLYLPASSVISTFDCFSEGSATDSSDSPSPLSKPPLP